MPLWCSLAVVDHADEGHPLAAPLLDRPEDRVVSLPAEVTGEYDDIRRRGQFRDLANHVLFVQKRRHFPPHKRRCPVRAPAISGPVHSDQDAEGQFDGWLWLRRGDCLSRFSLNDLKLGFRSSPLWSWR
jgi:hypothetical protein